MQKESQHRAQPNGDADSESDEGLGALLFLVISVCILIVVLIGVTFLCQGPAIEPPF